MRGLATAAGLLLLLGACAGTTPETAGPATGTGKASPRGVYKVGNPYQIGGVWYYPKEDYEYKETGIASWYGTDFHGKATANGESYDMNDLTAAHRTLPLPSIVRVTNLDNGRSMTLRVNDRGPFARNRIIDVSRRGAQLLGFERQGTAKVRVEVMAAESEQLAQVYRGSTTLGQALARTPSLPDPSAPMTVVAAMPPPAVTAPPPAPGADGTMLGAPILAPPPVASASAATIEQVPLAPPPGLGAPRPTAVAAPRPMPAPPPALVAAVDAPQPGIVTVEPVRSTQIYVQAGAFSQRANADRVRQSIGGRVTTVQVSGAPVHRVRVGPLRSVEEADQALSRVAQSGFPEARIIVE
jgi:rare lipoprotein A